MCLPNLLFEFFYFKQLAIISVIGICNKLSMMSFFNVD